MDEPKTPETTAARPLATRGECQQAVRDALGMAAAQGCRELWLCDGDYADWPLGEKAVIESLSAWAYAHRRLTVLARSFDELPRRHARWVEWRRQWAHVVDCRLLNEEDAAAAPWLLLAPGVVAVRVFDPVHYRGSLSEDPADALRCRELVDALSQRSTDSFPATTLGL